MYTGKQRCLSGNTESERDFRWSVGFQNKKDTSMRKQVRSLDRKEVVNLWIVGSQVEDLSRWSEPRGNFFFFWFQLLHKFLLLLTKKPGCRDKLGEPMLTCNKQQRPSELDRGDGGGVKWGIISWMIGEVLCFPREHRPQKGRKAAVMLSTMLCSGNLGLVTDTKMQIHTLYTSSVETYSLLVVFFFPPSIMPCYNGFPPNVSDVTPTEHQKQKESWRGL